VKKYLAFTFVLWCILSGVAISSPTQVDFLLSGLHDSNGSPLAGGQVFTYFPGTTTKQTCWTDKDQKHPATNPVTLTTNGQYQLYCDGWYKIIAKDSTGTTINTWDNLAFSPEIDQWMAQNYALTYVTGTQFTIAGDLTTVFSVGVPIKAIVTAGTIYGWVSSSSYTSVTTVNVTWQSGQLDAGLSAVYTGIANGYITSDTYTTLTQAVAAATTAGKPLLISSALTLTANVSTSIPITVTPTVGRIIQTGSFTLDVSNNFQAGRYQIFDSSINVTGPIPAYPEWWGSTPAAMQQCLKMPTCSLAGTYSMGTTALTSTGYLELIGTGGSGLLWNTSFAGTGLTVSGPKFKIDNVGLWKPRRTTPGGASSYALVNTSNTAVYDKLDIISPDSADPSAAYQGWDFGVKLGEWVHTMTNSRLSSYSRALWLDQMNEFNSVDTTYSANTGYAVYIDRGTAHSFFGGGIEGTPITALGASAGTSSHGTLTISGSMYFEGATGSFIELRGVSDASPMRGISIIGPSFLCSSTTPATPIGIDASGTSGLVVKGGNFYKCSFAGIFFSGGSNLELDMVGNNITEASGAYKIANSSASWSGTLYSDLHSNTVWDVSPAVLVDASLTTTVTVPGAVKGDIIMLGHNLLTVAGDQLHAVVSAVDTVKVTYTNKTGATRDVLGALAPGSGFLSIIIRKP
jgi:hypothetical protein